MKVSASLDADCAAVGFVDGVEDIDQRAGFELLADRNDFLQAAGLAEGADEAPALVARAFEAGKFADDDGPGEDAGNGQQRENGDRHWAAVVEHFH
jgi:hypothetical protein